MIFLIHSVLAFPAAGWVPLLQHWYYCITVLLTYCISDSVYGWHCQKKFVWKFRIKSLFLRYGACCFRNVDCSNAHESKSAGDSNLSQLQGLGIIWTVCVRGGGTAKLEMSWARAQVLSPETWMFRTEKSLICKICGSMHLWYVKK